LLRRRPPRGRHLVTLVVGHGCCQDARVNKGTGCFDGSLAPIP
jgi:hypothetical protein